MLEMANTTSPIRTRLDTLYKAISTENPATDQVSDEFLKACKIRLVQHHFEATDADDESDDEFSYLNHDPPILFSPLPVTVIEDHHLDRAKCAHPPSGKSPLDFRDYDMNSPSHHTEYLSWYLEFITFHARFRKRLPRLSRIFQT